MMRYNEISETILLEYRWEMNICSDRDVDDLLQTIAKFLHKIGKPVGVLDSYVRKRQDFLDRRDRLILTIERKQNWIMTTEQAEEMCC